LIDREKHGVPTPHAPGVVALAVQSLSVLLSDAIFVATLHAIDG